MLMTDDHHDGGVEDRVDGEHVQAEVGECVQAVDVHQLVVGQQNQHVDRQQTEHDDHNEHYEGPGHSVITKDSGGSGTKSARGSIPKKDH